jgi:hypothetical protein
MKTEKKSARNQTTSEILVECPKCPEATESKQSQRRSMKRTRMTTTLHPTTTSQAMGLKTTTHFSIRISSRGRICKATKTKLPFSPRGKTHLSQRPIQRKYLTMKAKRLLLNRKLNNV